MANDAGPSEVRVLGCFEAWVNGRKVSLGGPRQRAVLARIVAAGGRPVTADQIVHDVWGEHHDQPGSGSVHAYVSRLRKLLGASAIPRRLGGYVLDPAVVRVDAASFTGAVTRGRRALAGDDDTAADTALRTALACWRGDRPFGDLADNHFLFAEGARLTELRTVAAETLADVHVRQGREAQDVELLENLAAGEVLRESLAVRLVRALYAAGRQADALAAFERCRRALADQLGVDPSPLLREAHAAVLAHTAPAATVAARPAPPVSLPSRSLSFVGREALLEQVGRELDDADRRPHAVVLTGIAGTGKTEIALELAHRRRRDGHVAWWIAAEDPTGVAASLADLAAAVGITARNNEQDTRAELWRELDRTPGWVMVFDNVDDPGWMRPFLPTAVHGDVIITSRNPAWRQLGRPIPVPVLARAEAIGYVTRRSGDVDVAAADALADLLADLPIALEQACAYIEQTGMCVQDYVRLFRLHRSSLLIRDDTSGPSIATTWGLAFDRVRKRSMLAATVLETMAYLSPDDVTLAMLAPLAPDELDLHDALAELLRLSLVDRLTDGLRVHRLVQDVVRARMPAALRAERLTEATRLSVAAAHAEDVGDRTDAHIVALAGHAETLAVVPTGLVEALTVVAGHYAEKALYPAAEQILRQGMRLMTVEEPDPEPARHGALLCRLGEVLDAAGRLDEARTLHHAAVVLLAEAVDPDAGVLAHAHNRLGHVLNCADQAIEAIESHERAITTLRFAGRTDLLPPVLVDLGFTLWAVGKLDRAEDALLGGRDLLDEQGLSGTRAWAHATEGLGVVAQDRGDLVVATQLHRAAIEVFTRVCGGDHPDTAQGLDKLGYALRLGGDVDAAIAVHVRAVRLLERVFGTDDARVAMALTNLGLAHLDAGQTAAAVEVQARATTILAAQLGPEHASTLLATRRWAVALATDGQGVRARTVLGTAVETALLKAGGNAAERARIAADAAVVLPSGPAGGAGLSGT